MDRERFWGSRCGTAVASLHRAGGGGGRAGLLDRVDRGGHDERERCVYVRYSNGDVKMFDLRKRRPQYLKVLPPKRTETHREDGAPIGIAWGAELLNPRVVATQPVVGLDWSAEYKGLCCAASLDQTLR